MRTMSFTLSLLIIGFMASHALAETNPGGLKRPTKYPYAYGVSPRERRALVHKGEVYKGAATTRNKATFQRIFANPKIGRRIKAPRLSESARLNHVGFFARELHNPRFEKYRDCSVYGEKGKVYLCFFKNGGGPGQEQWHRLIGVSPGKAMNAVLGR